MPVLTTLPQPTWSGFDKDTLEKFIEFSIKRRMSNAKPAVDLLKKTIKADEAYLVKLNKKNESIPRQIDQENEYIRVTTDQIADYSARAKKSAHTLVLDLLQIPNVINVDSDQHRRPFVDVRVTAKKRFRRSPVYVGDIRITFARPFNDEVVVYVDVVDSGVDMGLYTVSRNHNTYAGNRRYLRPEPDLLADSSRLIEFINGIVHTVEQRNKRYAKTPVKNVDAAINKTAIDGTLINAVVKHLSSVGNLTTRLQSAKNRVRELEDMRVKYRDEIRQAHVDLRRLRAELADKLSNENKPLISVDTEDIARQLRGIMELPGCLGIRFTKQGVPVFHFRSSVEINGRRYDHGDFEIYFRTVKEEAGVLNIIATRLSNPYYVHEERKQGGRQDWFCFGSRAGEVKKLFKNGDFAACMNVVVNSINSINYPDQSSFVIENPRIADNLVWRTVLPSSDQ